MKSVLNRIHSWSGTHNILSLDVVLGALASGILAVKITNISPGWPWWVVLGLGVWFVYTTDHLIDALRANRDQLSKRHRFHYKHRRYLIAALCIAGGASLIIAFLFLDKRIIVFGFLVGILVLVYQLILVLSVRMKLLVQKEFFVALIYVSGIWGGPVILQEGVIHLSEWLVILTLFILAASDLLILSLYDEKQDCEAGFKSFTVQFGGSMTTKFVYLLLAMASTLSLHLIFLTNSHIYQIVGIIFMLMTAALGSMLIFTSFFEKHDRIRYLNELVFFAPGFMVLL